MDDINADDVRIMWGPVDSSTTETVRVIRRSDWDEQFLSNWAVFDERYDDAKVQTSLELILAKFISLSLHKEIRPSQLHKELLKVPEYRSAMEIVAHL
jgi:hypothetical protein